MKAQGAAAPARVLPRLRWSRGAGVLLFLAMALLFLVANRGAYEGYFQDDEFDNLSFAPRLAPAVWLETLLTPRFIPGNFRPAGHAYFAVMGRIFGLDFPSWVWPLHLIHFLNVWLVWILLRRLGGTAWSAGAGALLFAFHMAAFDVYWKPMYVFDLLCATFSLACLLFWINGRWVLSLAAFWLAYKSKELAVMLPAVLACYEYWLGGRRWKRLAPFFLVSISFGIQALLATRHVDTEYAFRFSPSALAQTVPYYAGRMALFPYGGLLLLALPLFFRDRRAWFGIAAMLLFFFPLAFLPGRLFSAYCYVPLIGAAVAASAVAERRRAAVALFFLAWIPFNYAHLRRNRRQALAIADENRRYTATLADYARTSPEMRRFIYDGHPANFHPWGIRGALKWFYGAGDLRLAAAEAPEAREMLRDAVPLAILSWNRAGATLSIATRRPGAPDASFIRMDHTTPLWQLGEGWFQLEANYRWTRERADARLYRPAGARAFDLTVNVSPDHIRVMKTIGVRLFLNGEPAGARYFSSNGWQTVRWDLAPAADGPVSVRFESDPFHPSGDPRALGVAVVSFGFVD